MPRPTVPRLGLTWWLLVLMLLVLVLLILIRR
jgi:hypothetical protein